MGKMELVEHHFLGYNQNSKAEITSLTANRNIQVVAIEDALKILQADEKYAGKVRDVATIMKKNNEILIKGEIPSSAIKKCKC
ncbi:hypothetical protein V8J88_23890 [Massilia sp. W12]|uniref:hypothetical protein n=1 Tax=Massilia sp. W12 TaxID=3126507 RepID=UPI0030CEA3BF